MTHRLRHDPMRKLIEKYNRSTKWRRLSEMARFTLEQALAIQKIPAPTFHEEKRAAYIKHQFEALGLLDVEVDDLYNVYGLLPGRNSSLPAVMISAHLDTVFEHDTDLSTRHDGGHIYGPGLGDNSVAVASLLGLVALWEAENLASERDLWIVATTREEGLGDLGGMRAAYEKLESRIDRVINVEGLAFGHVYHAGIAVRRLHITAKAPGGHSWLHFGKPSALHGIVQLGAEITAIQPASSPRTTYNIGMIEGGQSINSIASHAEMWLDMRSEDRDALTKLETQVRDTIESLQQDGLTFTIDVVGDRPAGYLSADHPLVQGSLAALKQVGVRGHLQTGSTDANIPLSQHCAAVTIGITQGGNAHRLDEYIETKPIEPGLKQLALLVLAAGNVEETEWQK